jgi:hypothetical protein
MGLESGANRTGHAKPTESDDATREWVLSKTRLSGGRTAAEYAVSDGKTGTIRA